MSRVSIVTVGPVEDEIVLGIEEAVTRSLHVEIARLPGLPEADYAWDPARKQYSSSLILNSLVAARPNGAVRLLGLTESDLYIPMLTFIYGQAQLGGGTALISLARLRQEFYGLAPDPGLLLERAHKEALHELGHTFGLVHCPDKGCAMALSTNIRQVDLKDACYCGGCAALAAEKERG